MKTTGDPAMTKQDRILVGIDAIAAYLDRSPSTVRRWYNARMRTMIPIYKLGNLHEAEVELLDQWRKSGIHVEGKDR